MSGSSDTGEATASIRLMWPFLRLTGADPAMIPTLGREGISPASFADPDTRIRYGALLRLLERAIEVSGDPTMGLRAGLAFQDGDLSALEYAARSCATVREALHCTARYLHLVQGGLDASLEEYGHRYAWRFRVAEGLQQPAAANDYTLAMAVSFIRRYTGRDDPYIEVHFMHDEPTDLSEYNRIFGGKICMGMPHNALITRRAMLDHPMLFANPGMQAAFSRHAALMLQKLDHEDNVAGRVRKLLLARVSEGDTGMGAIASELAMSVATLRRRLGDAGTSHKQILEEIRHELALKYLADRHLAISEVAFLLGFSHVTAFYKAFRRWEDGATPAEYRAAHS